MSPPQVIKDLVERFNDQLESYSSGKYNETQVRREFVDPLFKALGWDIDNSHGYSEAYKDVVHEDAIKIGGTHRAPDYSFRVGGTRKFFLEAKKPSISILADDEPAYQLRRYGWSAKLQISIVTNFRELVVYDCTVKPEKSDKASVARILQFKFDEYLSRWDELTNIFSKDAVYKGSFDKFASSKLRKGTTQVDDAFLADIERWREVLAKSFALRNTSLSQESLNYVVQATIDRIIFLRICEDRGIEPENQLLGIARRENVYKELGKIFLSADDRYNSGLFHFRKEPNRPEDHDTFTLNLNLDDKPLRDLISGLYYPDSPYQFSVVGADILGQVYEQFLGKIIRLTPSHRAVIDEKPEVKKAGGVYYTPTYIVDYIVKNTVGVRLKDKTITQVSDVKILDPACGSGSFLIAAYQYLLDWYLEKYLAEEKPPKQKVHKIGGSEWRLTLNERKRILLRHIFGVDVDSQAVEVTKLSLLLKVLERESLSSMRQQLEMFHERALPDLGDNVKCGNSLIGPNFLTHLQFDLLDHKRADAVNVFDWNTEYASIMKKGGFDVILGNPPYVNAWTMYESAPEIRDYINSTSDYNSADRHWDLYVLFIEKSMSLLRKSGFLSFIIPYSYCIQKYAAKSRRALTEKFKLVSIADLRTIRVFKNVPVITVIPVVQKMKAATNQIQVFGPGTGATLTHAGVIEKKHSILQEAFLNSDEAMWRLDLDAKTLVIIKTIGELSFPFGAITWVNYGAQMSSKRKGEFGKDFVLRDSAMSKTCKKTVSGRNLYRYQTTWAGQYVEWALAPKMYGPRESWFFETPKLMIRDITGTHRLEMNVDHSKLYCDHTILCALRACDVSDKREFDLDAVTLSKQYSLELLQALLASRVVSAFYYLTLTGEGVRTGGGFHTYPNTIRALPVFDVTKANATQRLTLPET